MATSTSTPKVTKGAIKAFVKSKLGTSDNWAKTALLRIYDYQTNEEQQVGYTKVYNGVGFTGCDGEILSSFAQQLQTKGYLSPKQTILVKRKMPKYWSQIIGLSNEQVLIAQVTKDLMSK